MLASLPPPPPPPPPAAAAATAAGDGAAARDDGLHGPSSDPSAIELGVLRPRAREGRSPPPPPPDAEAERERRDGCGDCDGESFGLLLLRCSRGGLGLGDLGSGVDAAGVDVPNNEAKNPFGGSSRLGDFGDLEASSFGGLATKKPAAKSDFESPEESPRYDAAGVVSPEVVPSSLFADDRSESAPLPGVERPVPEPAIELPDGRRERVRPAAAVARAVPSAAFPIPSPMRPPTFLRSRICSAAPVFSAA